jgi:hypothetical protein
LELFSVVVVMLVGAPRGKHTAGEFQALLAEGLLLGEPFCVAAKVALDVRPAHLPLVGVQVLKPVPAIRDHDPRERADERLELLAIAALGDLQERRLSGGRGPQRASVTAGAPAGLIDVHRLLIQHPVLQVAMRAQASEARWQIASTAPVQTVTPNRSPTARRSRGGRRSAGRSRSPPPPEVWARTEIRQSPLATGRWSLPGSTGSAIDGCDSRSRSR